MNPFSDQFPCFIPRPSGGVEADVSGTFWIGKELTDGENIFFAVDPVLQAPEFGAGLSNEEVQPARIVKFVGLWPGLGAMHLRVCK